MRIAQIVDAIAMECDLREVTLDQYYRVCGKFGMFLGRDANGEDLSYENVNGFLRSMKDKASTTVANYRLALLRVWGFGADRGWACDVHPRRVFRPKIPQRLVKSWSLSQVKMLLDACEGIPGTLRIGIPIAKFVQAMVRTGYDTGLRPSDLRRLEWCNLDSGSVTVVQSKTQALHRAKISPATFEALEAIRNPKRDLIFPLSKSGMRRIELLAFAQARAIGFNRLRGQGIGTLRKTHATELYRTEGAVVAAESLGHRSGPRVAMQHYIESSSLRQGTLPPKVG